MMSSSKHIWDVDPKRMRTTLINQRTKESRTIDMKTIKSINTDLISIM